MALEVIPIKSYRYQLVFIAACMGMFLFGLIMFTLGATLPDIIEKFELDEIGVGSLASLLPLGILIGSVIFGPVADKYGFKYLLIISALSIAFAMMGIALANQVIDLQISFFLIGLGGGTINGATNALVADISVDYGMVGSANLSLLGIFYGVGALTVPTVMALLTHVGYDIILLYLTGLMMIATVYFSSIRFPLAKEIQSASKQNFVVLFKEKTLWIVAFLLFFQSAFEGIFNNWTTVFLERERSFSQANALFSLSIFLVGLTIARLFLVRILKKVAEKKVLSAAVVLLLIGVLNLHFFDSKIAVFAAAFILGTGTSAIFPISFSYVSNLFQKMRGKAFSLVIFIAVLGNIVINFLMGVLSKWYGVDIYSWVLIFCIVSLIGMAIMLDRQKIT